MNFCCCKRLILLESRGTLGSQNVVGIYWSKKLLSGSNTASPAHIWNILGKYRETVFLQPCIWGSFPKLLQKRSVTRLRRNGDNHCGEDRGAGAAVVLQQLAGVGGRGAARKRVQRHHHPQRTRCSAPLLRAIFSACVWCVCAAFAARSHRTPRSAHLRCIFEGGRGLPLPAAPGAFRFAPRRAAARGPDGHRSPRRETALTRVNTGPRVLRRQALPAVRAVGALLLAQPVLCPRLRPGQRQRNGAGVGPGGYEPRHLVVCPGAHGGRCNLRCHHRGGGMCTHPLCPLLPCALCVPLRACPAAPASRQAGTR